MLEAMQGVPFGYVLCGIIWAVAMGFAVGNYACSLVHRLPRGKLLLDKTPYCGNCGALLQVKDLFPVISALILKHRCRYCAQPFPTSHTWTELLVGVLFVLAFLQYNFSEQYILIVCLGTFLITLAAIEANETMIMGKILVCVVVFGALLRVLVDGTIYNFFEGGLFGLLLGCVIAFRKIRKAGHIFVPPPLAMLLAAGGICVGGKGLPLFLPLLVVFYAAFWLFKKTTGSPAPVLLTIPFGMATILSVLYPSMLAG